MEPEYRWLKKDPYFEKIIREFKNLKSNKMSENATPLSFGQERVRLNFNPNADQKVEEIKRKTAELIDLCNQMQRDGKNARICSIAMTSFEEASMWAVKAQTS